MDQWRMRQKSASLSAQDAPAPSEGGRKSYSALRLSASPTSTAMTRAQVNAAGGTVLAVQTTPRYKPKYPERISRGLLVALTTHAATQLRRCSAPSHGAASARSALADALGRLARSQAYPAASATHPLRACPWLLAGAVRRAAAAALASAGELPASRGTTCQALRLSLRRSGPLGGAAACLASAGPAVVHWLRAEARATTGTA